MDRRTRCGSSSTVTLKEVTSILTTDYENLVNKPAINGTELTKETVSADIHLYSTIPEDHETLEPEESEGKSMNVLLLSDDGETAKVSVDTIEKDIAETYVCKAGNNILTYDEEGYLVADDVDGDTEEETD